MNFDPQKFFIGLIDFFSVIMPGGMLAYLCKDWFVETFAGSAGYPLDSPEHVLVFVFAAYLVGHLVFLLASLLDDWIYDPMRGWTDWGQISRRLARGKPLSPRFARRWAVSALLFDCNADEAAMQVQRIKARALHTLGATRAVNAFQWSKARLTEVLPQGLLSVQRFEADSKFFRSFVLVLVLLAVFYGAYGQWPAASACVTGIPPALWRYMDQRFKATQQAFWLIISIEAKFPAPKCPREDGLTHAGGVVVGPDGEVLLLQAERDRSQWVLPKGHIEAGEDPRETAVREVREETGHWARIEAWIEDTSLGAQPDAPRVRWFLLRLAEEGASRRAEDRRCAWSSLERAIEKAQFPETKALLEKLEGTCGGAELRRAAGPTA